MRFRSLGALGASVGVAALVVTSAFGLAGGQSAKDRTATAQKSHVSATTYIVQLADDPAVAYEGGVAGLKATAPAKGQKINPNSNDVKKYVAYLNGKHADAAAAVGAEKFYDYGYSFNGFAAKMNEQQAAKLASLGGVLDVTKDALLQPTTSSTPKFLGLTDPDNGLWKKLGGAAKAGENVIVGVVDTGIWPEHPSFSDQKDYVFRTGSSGKRNLAYGPAPSGWSGTCQSGEQFSQDMCTNKLIGARYYLSGFGHFGVIQSDFKSPRDADSHGSHTASTAAGNHGVQATGDAASFGQISGMAPRARIAAYKVCWNGDAGGCANSDSVAAIDQAVADGVDVINFSIGGGPSAFLDPVEVAFLFASDAGVFVAASAGNDGPGAGTNDHPSPWLTTVAATTHDRPSVATATVDGVAYEGASSNQVAVGSTPVLLSSAAGNAGWTAQQVALCFEGSLDPAKVTGKIVVCDRGVNDRVAKSRAVKQAGGVGMIMVNTSANSLNADLHSVPTVHLDHVDGAAIKAAITPASVATIGVVSGGAPAPKMAEFSSRGPNTASSADVLKPDLAAPGVDVLAAVSPHAAGRSFDLLSGTSMSSPHVAGLAALLVQAHPDWSPMAIKSALMTTARDTTDAADDLYAQGAGFVQPNSAVDPGLVYEHGFLDWLMFLQGQDCHCLGDETFPRIDASDLNQASIALDKLAGSQTVTRKVTNVGSAGTYTVSVDAPEGVDVTVEPASLTLAQGATASYTVTFTSNSDAEMGEPTFGYLTWSDGTHSVRSPLAVTPVALAVPGEVSGDGSPQSYDVTFGYSGDFETSTRGLTAATENADTVSDDPTNNFVVGGPGITEHEIEIPEGTTYARFALYDEQVGAGNDLDLYITNEDGDIVDFSGTGTSTEIVSLTAPEAGTYTAHVHGWQTAGGGTTSYILYTWALDDSSAGNMTVTAPSAAVLAESGEIELSFSGLEAGKRYLGAVDYSNGSEPIGSTIVYQTP